MKQLVRNVLAVAVIALCANAAQADPVRLNWTTTIFDPFSIPNLSVGNAVTLTFEFNVAGGNLSNARLNATNFVSYSFTLFDGRSATADLVGPGSTGLLYPANDFFVFDALGDLQEVQQFGIRDESMSSNVAAWNGALGILYNNGANRLSSATADFSVNSVTDGLLARSWTVESGNAVPEPVSLALVGAGLLACGVARRRRAAA